MNSIWENNRLVGHCLQSCPAKLWRFTKDEFTFFYKGRREPQQISVTKQFWYGREVDYTWSGANGATLVIAFERIGSKLLCDSFEFLGRRIGGACLTLLSTPLIPIGFTAKVVHQTLRSAYDSLSETNTYQKIEKIWKDTSLYGHCLTSAPAKLYLFATLQLNWHLTTQATRTFDRRTDIEEWHGGNLIFSYQAEYPCVPFELIEFVSRRIIGGSCLLIAGAISPLGLLAKSIHLKWKSL